jgi:hypothetical protein
MLIGSDFPKISWKPFGLDLVEPNAMIGDALILIVALTFAYNTSKISGGQTYYQRWKWFFIVFGSGFFFGGLGHLFFNYWGVPGKYASWYLGIIASFFVETALISIYPDEQKQRFFLRVSQVKMVLAFVAATGVFLFVDLTNDPQKGLLVPTLNSIIGLSLTIGALGYYYSKRLGPSFKSLWLSTFILIPSAVVQSMKINLHPWMDRNDISHILLIISLFMYYRSIKGYAAEQAVKQG